VAATFVKSAEEVMPVHSNDSAPIDFHDSALSFDQNIPALLVVAAIRVNSAFEVTPCQALLPAPVTSFQDTPASLDIIITDVANLVTIKLEKSAEAAIPYKLTPGEL